METPKKWKTFFISCSKANVSYFPWRIDDIDRSCFCFCFCFCFDFCFFVILLHNILSLVDCGRGDFWFLVNLNFFYHRRFMPRLHAGKFEHFFIKLFQHLQKFQNFNISKILLKKTKKWVDFRYKTIINFKKFCH